MLVVRNITYLTDADVKGKRLKIVIGNRTKAIYLINQFSLDASNSWSGQALSLLTKVPDHSMNLIISLLIM